MDSYSPDWTDGSSPSNQNYEEVGTGNSSTTTFYLDKKAVIADTYTIAMAASSGATMTALTETTHYTLDKDRGIITLTAGGLSSLSTNLLYARYQYNQLGLTDTLLNNALTRAQEWIDQQTGTHFCDGTVATPDYVLVTKEAHDGQGWYDRGYYTDRYPVANVTTTLSADASTTATSISVVSSNGFGSTGTLAIGTEKITYTGKTSVSFTGLTRGVDDTDGEAHTSGDAVTSYIIEQSTTVEGTTPSFEVLQKDIDCDVDTESGRVSILADDYTSAASAYWNITRPPMGVPNRFRATYLYGYSSIYDDIVRLTLMVATKELLHQTVAKAHISGQNEFNPSLINVDEDWIKQTIDFYRSYRSNNV